MCDVSHFCIFLLVVLAACLTCTFGAVFIPLQSMVSLSHSLMRGQHHVSEWSIPKVQMSWRFVMLFLWLVLGSRSRFTKVAWTIDRWRCSRCQRFARNMSTLVALTRTACVPLYGAARGAAPSLPRVHSSLRVRRSGPIT